MKGLIARRPVLSIFATLMLAFGIQSIVGAEDDTVPIAARFDIAISEIMYATNADKSPQWIELHNRGGKKVSLEGWEVTIENHPADRAVLATTLTFTLDAKVLDRNQVLLLVTEQGDNSGVGAAKGDIQADRVVILKDLIDGTQDYRLLSQTAFKITLTAAANAKTLYKAPSDIVGNLRAIPEWELPLIEDKRSSIIRMYDGNVATGHPFDGTTGDNWELAAEKDLQYTQSATYYGHRSDYGTPGYRTLTPLPAVLKKYFTVIQEKYFTVIQDVLHRTLTPLPAVLSKFRPTRLKNAVTIRWITESEMNCAGFNIKRSETRDGEFKVINSGMIPGAGTTNKRQSYRYADKTAKPNVIYYYQLECVFVDGTRQVLRMSRLKGNIGSSFRRFEEAPFWWRDLNQ